MFQIPSRKIRDGASLFIRNGIEFRLRDDISGISEHTESLLIEVDNKITGENTSTIIGVIYRPPNTDVLLSIEYMEGILETVKSDRMIRYMMGDYNINSLKSSVQSPTSDFL